MKINYPHLLNRVCNAPLAIEQRHLQPLLGFLGTRVGIDLKMPIEAAAQAEQTAQNFGDIPENIGVVDVSGPLVRRASGLDALCGMTSYERIENDFMDAVTDPSKQAILMLFDSPGGEVGGLFDLADLIQAQRGQKPIYAAVSESAFSAAYALASACDRIFLTRTGGVGSIGVFTMHVDMSAMDEKDGLKFTYVFAGNKKLDGNPHEPLSGDARGTIQSEVDRTYDLFVQTVARNRGIDAKKVRGTEAGLFFGAEGIAVGLADDVGTVAEVVAAIQKEIQIKPLGGKRAESANEVNNRAAEAANPTQEVPSTMTTEQAAALPKTQVAEETKKADDEQMEEIKKGNKKAAPLPEEDDEEKCADPKEVIFLCKVSRRPELASEFIEKGSTLADVRKALLANQQQEQQQGGAIGHHVSLTGADPVNQLDSLAKARAASTGKSYSAAYAEVMRDNPKLYTQYLDMKDAVGGAKR